MTGTNQDAEHHGALSDTQRTVVLVLSRAEKALSASEITILHLMNTNVQGIRTALKTLHARGLVDTGTRPRALDGSARITRHYWLTETGNATAARLTADGHTPPPPPPGGVIAHTLSTHEVTDEIVFLADRLTDHLFPDGTGIRWVVVLGHLNGITLSDGTRLTIGDNLMSPAAVLIRHRVAALRRHTPRPRPTTEPTEETR